MKENFFDTTVQYLKTFIPFALTVLLILFNFTLTHLPLFHFFKPNLALCCLYFWVLYRPDLFRIPSVIILGFMLDTLSGEPFGMNVCVLVFAYILTSFINQYINANPFLSSWIYFLLIAFGVFLFKWMIFSLYYKMFLSVFYVFISYLVTILTYPIVARLNIFIQEHYLTDDEMLHEQE